MCYTGMLIVAVLKFMPLEYWLWVVSATELITQGRSQRTKVLAYQRAPAALDPERVRRLVARYIHQL